MSTLRIAKLDEQKLEQIQQLEQQIGETLVALEPDNTPLAALTSDQVAKLRKAEKELGVILLAFDGEADNSSSITN